MKASYQKKAALCLLLASSLSSCLSYDKSSSDDDFASDNVIAVDNSVTQGDAANDSDKSPCSCLIWKPISESDGNLALIFDEAFPVPFSTVQVNRLVEEEETEELAKVEPEFCEFSSFDENGRQVWRCSEPGEAYDGTFIIEYGTEVCEGMVDEPGERHELNASAGTAN